MSRDLTYLCGFLGFAVEGFLFYYHVHDGMRDSTNVQMHQLLVTSILASSLAILAEIMSKKDLVALAMFRSMAVLWQGLWFIHLGFTLFPPGGPRTGIKLPLGHHQEMINVMTFLVYLLGSIIFMFFIIGFFLLHKQRFSREIRFRKIELVTDDSDDGDEPTTLLEDFEI